MVLFCTRLLFNPPALLQADDNDAQAPVIRGIIIDRGQIYPEHEAESTRLFRVLNAIHWMSREQTIRQELLFKEGDGLDVELIAETERNLRALSVLSVADVLVEPIQPGWVDVRIRTRDAFTRRFEASTSFVGGQAHGRLNVGERNLFGTGVSLSYVQTRWTNKEVNRIQFFEPRVFGSRKSFFARYAGGRVQSAGRDFNTVFYQFALARPFYRLDTRHSYGISYVFDDGIDTFYNGNIDKTTEVERKKVSTALIFANRWGTRFSKQTLTTSLAYHDTRYGERFGTETRDIAVPEDTVFWSLIENLTHKKTAYFLEQDQLDALEGVEDIEVGWSAGLSAGAGYRKKKNGHDRSPFFNGINADALLLPSTHSLLALHAASFGRIDSGRYLAWETEAFIHYYYQGFREQTLVASIAFDAVYEGEDLERELILDEASGLRGYRAKAFSGNKRLRLNVEDRIFTPFEFYRVVFGFALFADSGYVWKRGENPKLADLRSSIGFGLRIGSLPLIKNNVIRIDFAFPLNKDDAAGFSISVSGGQLIQLLKNAEENEEF